MEEIQECFILFLSKFCKIRHRYIQIHGFMQNLIPLLFTFNYFLNSYWLDQFQKQTYAIRSSGSLLIAGVDKCKQLKCPSASFRVRW